MFRAHVNCLEAPIGEGNQTALGFRIDHYVTPGMKERPGTFTESSSVTTQICAYLPLP